MVEMLQRHRTSYLTWAMSQDEDMYRQRREAGLTGGNRKPDPPESFDYPMEMDALSGLFSLMQQLIHVTAVKGTKAAKKKPRITKLPIPESAAKRVEELDARHMWAEISAMLVNVDAPPAGALWWYPPSAQRDSGTTDAGSPVEVDEPASSHADGEIPEELADSVGPADQQSAQADHMPAGQLADALEWHRQLTEQNTQLLSDLHDAWDEQDDAP